MYRALSLFVLATLFFGNIVAAQTVNKVQTDVSSFTKLPLNFGGNTQNLDGIIQYQWPGIYFEARFIGPQVYFKIDDSYNRFRVRIDNKEVAIIEKPNMGVYEVSDIGVGQHIIRIEKISESQGSFGSFHGFFAKNEDAKLTPPLRRRKIEFIGDSYMVGYGNLSQNRACPGQLYQNTDNTKSYVQFVARHFNADFQVNAYSGIGMARNYNNNMGEKTASYLYGRPIFNQDYKSDTSQFIPKIIIVALGTNDFSTPIKAGEKWKSIEELKQDYVAKYLGFLEQLRTENPNATIIIAANLGANQNHLAALNEISQIYSKADRNFHAIYLPKLENTGCDWHPNLNDHLAMAQILISKIKDLDVNW